ncbi:phosphoenolpyruvate--protein phosphotransferase [Flintibacter sp. HCN-6482]|uniref:phosphoenolpyruvate--protein phosphotransferase n=1 Tax=Flintibacter sp. HCN-6482 TaxID=3134672 RepID=UPI0030BDB043
MRYPGIATSRGLVEGTAFLYAPYVPNVVQVSKGEPQDEMERYQAAHRAARTELEQLCTNMTARDPERAKIFQAHMGILDDIVMTEEIEMLIRSEDCGASWAVDQVYSQYAEVLRMSPNSIISERAADMADVRLRLLRCLEGRTDKGLAGLLEPVVLFAHDLLPSDTAALDPSQVLAIVTEVGGITSHSSIIARSYGIPALAGVTDICQIVKDGQLVLVDTLEGALIVQPSKNELSNFRAKQVEFHAAREREETYRKVQPTLLNGERVQVMVNVGAVDDKELQCAAFVDGVGLFRTEFLYMDRQEIPDEEEQYRYYRRVFEVFAPAPVTVRTLDIGGDKEAPCLDLPKELNPFLGNRAVRLCFDHPDMFLTQLRAILRASAHGRLKLMFPMVGGIEDIRQAKALLERAKEQLQSRGEQWDQKMSVGVMIEIPSLALLADQVAKEVDFASIGTNDLTQYTLAVDRVNPVVSQYYRPFHPALMRLLRFAIQAFNDAGKQISVCGEMGSDPLAVTALLGMGLRTLSVGASSVAMVKELVCNLDLWQAEQCARDICVLTTEAEVKERLERLKSKP